jgi:alpha-glucuronidase
MQKQWNSVQSSIDPQVFADVSGRLAAQHREALNWRDACVLYFQQYSKQPILPHTKRQPERSTK